MQRFIGLLMLFVSLSFGLKAQSTSIFFQNNTELEFGVAAIQSGTHVMDANEWSLKTTDIDAWEISQELLETNRNSGIHNGETFYFDVFIWHGTDTMQLQLKLEGTFVGSDMEHSLKGPGFDHPWYDNGGFHEETLIFGGLPVTIKYKPDGTDAFFNRDIVFAIQDNRPKYTIDSADFSNPNVINVLSYNIQFLPPPIGSFNAPERADFIPRYFSPYQDVVIFQEAFEDAARNNNLTPAMQAAGFPHQTVILNDGQIIENGGVIIYSRWPIELEDEYDYRSCDNNSGDCFAAKGILYAKINKLGKPYHIFGTHMEAGGNPNDIAIKKEQFGEQRDFIAAQNIPVDEAVIIGGDMNTDASSGHYPDLIDSLNPIIGLHKGFYASTDVTRDSGNIIDHVWSDRGHLVPLDCYTKVWVYRSVDDDLWDIFDPSDHLPVNGRFEYPDVDTPTVITTEICGNNSSLQLSAPIVHPNLSYQWYLDGLALAGATNATYLNMQSTASDTGRYSCQIRTQFTVMDTSALGHPNWPDTATQYFDFDIAEVSYNAIDMNPTINQQSDTLFSSASTGNQWYDGNGPITGANDSFYVLTQAGSYYVVVTQGNCTSNNSNTVAYTSIHSIERGQFNLYPNPAKNQITVEAALHSYDLEIIDAMGRVQQTHIGLNGKLEIDLSNWASGIYWMRLTNKNEILIESFMIN